MEDNKNALKKFIGKIFEKKDSKGETFCSIIMDNPNDTKKDSTERDPYHKGKLFYVDSETGECFQVFQMAIRGVSENSKKIGAVNSIMIDLGNKYHVKKVD